MTVKIESLVAVNCGMGAYFGPGVSAEVGSMEFADCGVGMIAEGTQSQSISQFIAQHVADADLCKQLTEAAVTTARATDRAEGQTAYERFIELAANHLAVLQPIITWLTEKIN